MSTSPNGTNPEKKPPPKTPPTDEEIYYGIVDTRSEEEKREEAMPQEQANEGLAPEMTERGNKQQTPRAENARGNGESAASPVYPPNIKPGLATRLEDIMDIIGEGKTIWDALSAVFGLHEANYKYLILERTRLTKEEANLVSDAIFVAEHGIGTEPFDFPIPEFADWIVSRLHAFISVDMGHGNARDEFREITSTWVASLKAKAAAQSISGEAISPVDQGVTGRNP